LAAAQPCYHRPRRIRRWGPVRHCDEPGRRLAEGAQTGALDCATPNGGLGLVGRLVRVLGLGSLHHVRDLRLGGLGIDRSDLGDDLGYLGRAVDLGGLDLSLWLGLRLGLGRGGSDRLSDLGGLRLDLGCLLRGQDLWLAGG
jgi:hypothetical protein